MIRQRWCNATEKENITITFRLAFIQKQLRSRSRFFASKLEKKNNNNNSNNNIGIHVFAYVSMRKRLFDNCVWFYGAWLVSLSIYLSDRCCLPLSHDHNYIRIDMIIIFVSLHLDSNSKLMCLFSFSEIVTTIITHIPIQSHSYTYIAKERQSKKKKKLNQYRMKQQINKWK